MYFANNLGVMEYDGVSWRLTPVSNQTIVWSFAIDKEGRLYIGAHDEFGYFIPDSLGQLSFVSLTDRIPGDKRHFFDVRTTLLTSHGIYFGTEQFLFCWQPENSPKEQSNPDTEHIKYGFPKSVY